MVLAGTTSTQSSGLHTEIPGEGSSISLMIWMVSSPRTMPWICFEAEVGALEVRSGETDLASGLRLENAEAREDLNIRFAERQVRDRCR